MVSKNCRESGLRNALYPLKPALLCFSPGVVNQMFEFKA